MSSDFFQITLQHLEAPASDIVGILGAGDLKSRIWRLRLLAWLLALFERWSDPLRTVSQHRADAQESFAVAVLGRPGWPRAGQCADLLNFFVLMRALVRYGQTLAGDNNIQHGHSRWPWPTTSHGCPGSAWLAKSQSVR